VRPIRNLFDGKICVPAISYRAAPSTGTPPFFCTFFHFYWNSCPANSGSSRPADELTDSCPCIFLFYVCLPCPRLSLRLSAASTSCLAPSGYPLHFKSSRGPQIFASDRTLREQIEVCTFFCRIIRPAGVSFGMRGLSLAPDTCTHSRDQR